MIIVDYFSMSTSEYVKYHLRHAVECCGVFLLTAGILFGSPLPAQEVQRSESSLTVTLPNEVVLRFLLEGDRLLGLHTAAVRDVDTTSPDTLFRPYLAEDMFGTPVLMHDLIVREVKPVEGGIELHLDVRATSSLDALQKFYNMTPDPDAVEEDEVLRTLRLQAEAARQELQELAILHDTKTSAAFKRLQDEVSQPDEADPAARQQQDVRRMHYRHSFDKTQARAPSRMKDQKEQVQRFQQKIRAYQTERKKRAEEQGILRIHTDYFGHAIPQLPAESAREKNLRALTTLPGEICGHLVWRFTPETVNIAGWDWQGWRHQISYTGLPDSPEFRVLRTQGTWELEGSAVGTTVVAMRYRGLGSIEETFQDNGRGGIDRCFTTTEIIPGAVQGVPVISPAVPASLEIGDRGYGMKHRLSPWIGMMARGGGANVVDFQYRPHAVYASYPVRQGNLRTCTEAFPGDREISIRDEEWFAKGRSFTSIPFLHLVLVPPEPFTRWQSITRWQEVDQHVRDQMSEELKFLQPEPLPAAGYNTDYDWEGRIGALSGQIESVLGPSGVRMILQHQPGWINGRDLRRKKDPRYAGGGDCTPYDFTAEGKIAEAWQEVSRACARWEIDYYAWLSTIAHKAGEFAVEVDAEQGGLKPSWGEVGNGEWTRSRILYAFDPLNPVFNQKFIDRMKTARDELGYQGIWADSWQKWTVSFSAHAEGRPPLARAFWELYAKWSHEGVALMSESAAFPGLSCSIELPNHGYEDEWWFMQHTVKWFRATSRPPGAGTEKATDFTFRMYANKATVCWNTEGQKDLGKVVPDWTRMAHEYLAALPTMRRSWVLPEGAGVLWLGYEGDQKGVLYPFEDGALPQGIRASKIVEGDAVASVRKHHVLSVQGNDLLEAFGLIRGPLDDPRIGRTYKPFVGSTPAFVGNE